MMDILYSWDVRIHLCIMYIVYTLAITSKKNIYTYIYIKLKTFTLKYKTTEKDQLSRNLY